LALFFFFEKNFWAPTGKIFKNRQKEGLFFSWPKKKFDSFFLRENRGENKILGFFFFFFYGPNFFKINSPRFLKKGPPFLKSFLNWPLQTKKKNANFCLVFRFLEEINQDFFFYLGLKKLDFFEKIWVWGGVGKKKPFF